MTKLLLNQNLIKSLINSDFLLIEKKKNRKNIKYNSSNIFSIDKKTIFCLEPLEVSMLLKQMIYGLLLLVVVLEQVSFKIIL